MKNKIKELLKKINEEEAEICLEKVKKQIKRKEATYW